MLPTLAGPDLAVTERWLDMLGSYGLVVVERWAAGDRLERLRAEHQDVFDERRPSARELDYYRPGIGSRAVRVLAGEIGETLPAIHSFLTDQVLCDVASAYLGPGAQVNHAAYLTLDVAHGTPVTALHYDRKRALKAFLCITDADEAGGAPAFVPGSHRHGSAVRAGHLAAGLTVEELPITSGHDGWTPISLSSPAGSLVLFDTDCLHMGGTVTRGRTRRVLRGHSHAAVSSMTRSLRRR